jgi:hypothetical protein
LQKNKEVTVDRLILGKTLLKRKGSSEGKGFTVLQIPGFPLNIGRSSHR